MSEESADEDFKAEITSSFGEVTSTVPKGQAEHALALHPLQVKELLKVYLLDS
jgi:hypothetical protein